MSEHTVEQSTVRRLERSRSDRMLAGVSGGLARYFDMHPAFYRVGFVVLTLIGGAGIIIYLAAALVIPDEGHKDSIADSVLRERRDRPWPLVGLGLVAVAGLVLLARASFWPHGDAAWVLLLLAGATILWLTRREPSRPAPGQPDTLADASAPRAVAARDSRRMRRVGAAIAITIAAVVAALLVAAAVFAAVLPLHLSRGVGDRTYAVADAANLQESYSLGIGELRLDLSGLELPVGETHVRASVDIGRLEVTVPSDAALQARGEARFGEVELLGGLREGRDVESTVHEDGERILVVDGHVGAGELVVARAVR